MATQCELIGEVHNRTWVVSTKVNGEYQYIDDFGNWVINIDWARDFRRNDASVIVKVLCKENPSKEYKVLGIKGRR